MNFDELHKQMEAPLMPMPDPEALRRYYLEVCEEAGRLERGEFLDVQRRFHEGGPRRMLRGRHDRPA